MERMVGQAQIGTTVDGKYRIERVLGRGGMGVVVAARHLRLGHLVAIKFLVRQDSLTGDAIERLLREARAVMRLKTDHVARVFDIGVHEHAGPYLVMEYLRGQDLGAVVRSEPLPIEHAVDYVLQACEALSEAHAKSIIHRDLKPSNLLLTERADGAPRVKVIDFGLSKSLRGDDTGSLTRSGAVLGSPWFMAPEQMRGASEVDARADIWALGATLYMLVTGQPPFPGKNVLDVYESIRAGRPRLNGVGAAQVLDAAMERCLQVSPYARYATVAELAEQLASILPHAKERAAAIRRIAKSADDDHNSPNTPPTVRTDSPSTLPPQEPSWQLPGTGVDDTAAASLVLSRSIKSGALLVGPRFRVAIVLVSVALGLGSLLMQRDPPAADLGAVPGTRTAAAAPAVPPEPSIEVAPTPTPTAPASVAPPPRASRARTPTVRRAPAAPASATSTAFGSPPDPLADPN